MSSGQPDPGTAPTTGAALVDISDLDDLVRLVTVCRAAGGAEAFPAETDIAWLLADPDARAACRLWRDGNGEPVAFAMAQTALGNVLFDVRPDARSRLTRSVVETVLAMLAASGARTVDTPLESDDLWRQDVLAGAGFDPTGDDVVHLSTDDPAAYRVFDVPDGVRVTSNAADLDAYVTAHRAAFGTTYLTRAGREAWSATAGYDPAYDVALHVDGALAAFAVSYLREGEAEIGVVGVVPDRRGRGLARLVVGLVLDRLVAAGATSAWLSTSSTNAPMLAVATSCGFAEFRRTSWWRRIL